MAPALATGNAVVLKPAEQTPLTALRLGELVRGTFGAGLFGIPVVTVFATMLVERALDVVVLVLLFLLAARFGGFTGGALNYGGYFWFLLGGLLACLLILVFIDEIISHHFFSGFFGRFPRLTRGLGHLALGVKAFHSFKSAAAVEESTPPDMPTTIQGLRLLFTFVLSG